MFTVFVVVLLFILLGSNDNPNFIKNGLKGMSKEINMPYELSKVEGYAKDIKLAPLNTTIPPNTFHTSKELNLNINLNDNDKTQTNGAITQADMNEQIEQGNSQQGNNNTLTQATEGDSTVPHNVHQIWVGEKPIPRGIIVWRRLCEKYGYKYYFWNEANIRDFHLANEKYYLEFLNGKNYQGAADVARYEILSRHGGIYTDADILPVDLPIFDYLPKTGFAITPEHQSKHITLSTGSIFFGNSFIVSSPKHSILQHIIKSLPVNYENFREIGYIDPQLVTGPYLLTSCVHGLYTVIDKTWILVDEGNKDHFHLTEFYLYSS